MKRLATYTVHVYFQSYYCVLQDYVHVGSSYSLIVCLYEYLSLLSADLSIISFPVPGPEQSPPVSTVPTCLYRSYMPMCQSSPAQDPSSPVPTVPT